MLCFICAKPIRFWQSRRRAEMYPFFRIGRIHNKCTDDFHEHVKACKEDVPFEDLEESP